MLISLFWTQPPIKHLEMQKENFQENIVFKALRELLYETSLTITMILMSE